MLHLVAPTHMKLWIVSLRIPSPREAADLFGHFPDVVFVLLGAAASGLHSYCLIFPRPLASIVRRLPKWVAVACCTIGGVLSCIVVYSPPVPGCCTACHIKSCPFLRKRRALLSHPTSLQPHHVGWLYPLPRMGGFFGVSTKRERERDERNIFLVCFTCNNEERPCSEEWKIGSVSC